MQSDTDSIHMLEQVSLLDPDADALRVDMTFLDGGCVQLVLELFLFCQYNVDCPWIGRAFDYLRGLLETFPDNKHIEDMHEYLREMKRMNKNNVIGRMSRYRQVVLSGRLESRGIQTSGISKEEFCALFGSSEPRRSIARKFEARSHVRFKNHYVQMIWCKSFAADGANKCWSMMEVNFERV